MTMWLMWIEGSAWKFIRAAPPCNKGELQLGRIVIGWQANEQRQTIAHRLAKAEMTVARVRQICDNLAHYIEVAPGRAIEPTNYLAVLTDAVEHYADRQASIEAGEAHG